MKIKKNHAAMPPVAILAGGLGTRMAPHAQKIPKALVKVAGRPFIAHQLELLRRRGLRRVVLCVGHLGEMIRDVVGDGSPWDLRVEYAFDGPVLLGTGGSIKKALPLLGEVFFVLYGDSYLDFDYLSALRAFQDSGKLGLMTVYRNSGQWGRSNILFEQGKILDYNKRQPAVSMRHIDYGLGFLKKAALASVPPSQPYDLADLYRSLIAQNQLAGYEVSERFYEIGSPEGLEAARRHLALQTGGV